MNDTVKSVLYRLSPSLYARLLHLRYQRENIKQNMTERNTVANEVIERHGLKILQGPFAGMSYVRQATGSAFIPKLVGSYESELIPLVNIVIDSAYDTIVDVGCAEGYYAVGLAMRMPAVTVRAFDSNPTGQYLCKMMACENGVEKRVLIAGSCDPTALKQAIQGKTFLLCDCEGYEQELLMLTEIPELRNTTILVELHDCFVPGVSERIVERFKDSHDIQILESQDRDVKDYPYIHFLTPQKQQMALDEIRLGAMQWAYMTPKP